MHTFMNMPPPKFREVPVAFEWRPFISRCMQYIHAYSYIPELPKQVPASQQETMSAEQLRQLVAFPSINRPALGGFWEGHARNRSGQ